MYRIVGMTAVLVVSLVACGGQPPPQGEGSAGGSAGGAAGGVAGGQGGGSGGGAASCLTATASLCERGLSCSGGPKLVIVWGGTATAQHLTLSDCQNYYRYLSCPAIEADGGVSDWGGCQAAIQSAACATTSKGPAVGIPAACGGLTL